MLIKLKHFGGLNVEICHIILYYVGIKVTSH